VTDELLNLGLRWAHVFTGILWIGQTWLFLWLDHRFEDGAENPGGRVHIVHSGGFYVVEKQRVLEAMPKTLHWFKWEAALTWLTGLGLLLLVYYRGELLVAPDGPYPARAAAALGLGSLIVGWLVYDQLWMRLEGRAEALAAALSYALVVMAGFGFARVMSGRAAWMHVGALLGTLMAANVWERIIPGQRLMVNALTAGTPPDLAVGERAKQRSKHNTFMVVPLVLIMLSNHFPTLTYGHARAPFVLAFVLLAGAALAAFLRRR
jgi:uncharacterized membrane protein